MSSELRYYSTYVYDWGTGSCQNVFRDKVTGNHGLGSTVKTDEVIQWAAHKWGIDEDILRGVAVKESYWNQSQVGDYDSVGGNGYMSYGLMQVRRDQEGQLSPNWNGTFPLSKDSVAFNLDYWGYTVRQYFEGCATWLNTVSGNGGTYYAGDIWGSVGAWYAGRWWNDGAQSYIAAVQDNITQRVWERSGF